MSEELENPKAELERLAAIKEYEESVKSSTELSDEEKSEEVKIEAPAYTEVELEQMEKGWDPNHKGANAVSAEEYKRVGELIDAKRKASKEAYAKAKEVEELKSTVKQVVEHFKDVEIAAYNKALKDLYDRKMEKVAEGDVDSVIQIEREQAALKRPEVPTITPEEPVKPVNDLINDPDVVAFKEEFKKELTGSTPSDKAMQAYIERRANEYEREHSNLSVKESLDLLRGELKEVFPNKFENPNKKQPSPVATSTTSSAGYSKVSTTNLSVEQRMLYNEIKRVDPSYTVEAYVEQLKLTGKFAN